MRRTAHLVLWVLLVGYAPAGAAELVDLGLIVKDKKIFVTFRMTDAFNDDIERSIASGLPVSFRYDVQLKKVRTVWFNQKIVTRRITNTVKYDNITERYTLSRDVDGGIVATELVADRDAMMRFMTAIRDLPLFDVSLLEPNNDYYLRVKGLVKERNLFLFIPWDQDSGWEKTYFTYLP
jgi:Domain of unknown function (DUF4390)